MGFLGLIAQHQVEKWTLGKEGDSRGQGRTPAQQCQLPQRVVVSMLNTLQRNPSQTDTVNTAVSAHVALVPRSLCQGKKGAGAATAIEEQMSPMLFYHLWSEGGRRETMYACNYKPGA